MFLFQISDYDNPALDMETVRLFQQRLEAYSRHTVPLMWNVTDKLNAHSTKGQGREVRRVRYRIYGALLLALGIFALVSGLMEPRIPSLILVGTFAIITGLLEFYLACPKKPLRAPASCQKEAKEMLSGRRAVDWSKVTVTICFDETGMIVSSGVKQEVVPYEKMTGIFNTENLWLLVYDNEKGLLLQKKDLISGDIEEFLPYLHHRITEISQK